MNLLMPSPPTRVPHPGHNEWQFDGKDVLLGQHKDSAFFNSLFQPQGDEYDVHLAASLVRRGPTRVSNCTSVRVVNLTR